MHVVKNSYMCLRWSGVKPKATRDDCALAANPEAEAFCDLGSAPSRVMVNGIAAVWGRIRERVTLPEK